MGFKTNKLLITYLFLIFFVGCALMDVGNPVQKTIDAKKLIQKDMLMYKSRLNIKILGASIPYTGIAINYFDNGGKKSEGRYVSGKKDGNWTLWYEVPAQWVAAGSEIRIESEGRYKEGKRNGTWTYYSTNGEIRESGNYKDQMRVGAWSYYDENGYLDIVMNY